eukprot:TRINITY_DN16625_c0_g1_i1.p1 TRINITY_DN16625_c0_g1~~TRINITY_DN16625_c0_g1_i1.p1  ORF type:complete len:150 (+),score=44.80 TRINITY_DN16625_c0_g1_i1:58-507(+)
MVVLLPLAALQDPSQQQPGVLCMAETTPAASHTQESPQAFAKEASPSARTEDNWIHSATDTAGCFSVAIACSPKTTACVSQMPDPSSAKKPLAAMASTALNGVKARFAAFAGSSASAIAAAADQVASLQQAAQQMAEQPQLRKMHSFGV